MYYAPSTQRRFSISSTFHGALVLPGAVAKGAYEAGVIAELADNNIPIDRIVATSSGALNGVAYAAGIRCGREKEMAANLVSAWVEGGGWHNSLHFSTWNMLKGRGLSSREGLLKMLKALIHPCPDSAKREVQLRIIVAPLNGVTGAIGKNPATTYERLLHFSGKDFDDTEGLARMFDATTAACAFPGLYAPVEIDGLGHCVDGGTVNNAPIKYVLDESDIDQIYMPIPFPAVMPPNGSSSWWGLSNSMIEILINERLYRDLKDMHSVNEDIVALNTLVSRGVLTEPQLEIVKATLRIRHVECTQIRPAESLGGNSFSGFFSKSERLKLVAEGRKAARATIADKTKRQSG